MFHSVAFTVKWSRNTDTEEKISIKVAAQFPVEESDLINYVIVAVFSLSWNTFPDQHLTVAIEDHAFNLGTAYVYSNSPHEDAKSTFGMPLFQPWLNSYNKL
jgi:hypothetical protein